MDDYARDWARLTAQWRWGRRAIMVHLLAVPPLIYLFSFALKRFAPAGWLISGEPVWYFIVAAALWVIVFTGLLLRDRHYTCPKCATKVRPFGGSEMPSLVPQPCPKCGLRAPLPPY